MTRLTSSLMEERDTSLVAAHMLKGTQLEGGWVVLEKLTRPRDSTGSNFSVGYIVERNGERAFLKALDYSFAFELVGNTAFVLETMTRDYVFESQILERCAASRMDRIVRALATGEVVVAEAADVKNVSYLIFELADGDVRNALDAHRAAVDYAWAFRTLHHAATGLVQLHTQNVAHQDVKPSNVLTFGPTLSKLGDLGRASSRSTAGPHDEAPCAGDPQYAPPELLYGQVSPDWRARRQACDMYLLGSLAMFLFSETTATSAILTFLDEQQHYDVWQEHYSVVLPYVRVAFDRAMDVLEVSLPPKIANVLMPIIRQLCDPDPELRGHPNTRAMRHGNPYSLERYRTEFDLLARRAEIGTFRDAA